MLPKLNEGDVKCPNAMLMLEQYGHFTTQHIKRGPRVHEARIFKRTDGLEHLWKGGPEEDHTDRYERLNFEMQLSLCQILSCFEADVHEGDVFINMKGTEMFVRCTGMDMCRMPRSWYWPKWPLDYWPSDNMDNAYRGRSVLFRGCPYRVHGRLLDIRCGQHSIRFNLDYPELIGHMLTSEDAEPANIEPSRYSGEKGWYNVFLGKPLTLWSITLQVLADRRKHVSLLQPYMFDIEGDPLAGVSWSLLEHVTHKLCEHLTTDCQERLALARQQSMSVLPTPLVKLLTSYL